MAKVELLMPKMGESIMEATILNWVKKAGEKVEADETILEIATDKVDSEIPSPVNGIIAEILFPVDAVVEVGKPIAILETESAVPNPSPTPSVAEPASKIERSSNGRHMDNPESIKPKVEEKIPYVPQTEAPIVKQPVKAGVNGHRFYSPLVKNIARKEGVSAADLDTITGSGSKGRVTKRDILKFVENRGSSPIENPSLATQSQPPTVGQRHIKRQSPPPQPVFTSGQDEIIQMDRMRKLIADHMVHSKHTSAHVTSFVEADVTDIVEWRNTHKGQFKSQYGEKITFTPIFVEAVVNAIKDFPLINASVDGDKIIVKKNINIGMAAALPSGNLIVPVIKNADHLNLVGITRQVNDLATRARENKLKPEEISGGTFTLTNVGTFGNVMGTPIINQPQVAIMATGTIKKKPAVIETEYGDVIAIRSMMFLSLSYDHRVVDGFLGGSFLRKVADNLEGFNKNRSI